MISRKFMYSILKTLTYLLYGLITTLFDRKQPNRAIVLMYHSVCDQPQGADVSPADFERQMEYLAKKKDIVSLKTVVDAYLYKIPLSEKKIAVTFDDGYEDLFTTVLPVIKKHHIPITVFVPSDLSACTDKGNKKRLSQDGLRRLIETGLVSVESHGQTHSRLTDLGSIQLERELMNSRNELFSLTGVQPTLIAYPYGARNIRVEAATRKAGYEAGFGITDGLVGSSKTSYGLHRVQIDQTMPYLLFLLRLTASVEVARKLRRLRKKARNYFSENISSAYLTIKRQINKYLIH